jgi:hypothetical protein
MEINGAGAGGAYISVDKISDARSGEGQEANVQTVRKAQRKCPRRRHAAAPRRWLVLLLTLALATSGLLHALEGDHTAAANYSQEVVVMSADDCGEPCCHDHGSQTHGATCTTMSGCSLCVPIAGSAMLALPGAGSASRILETVHSGRIQSPDIRPPKFLQNV